MPDATLNGFVSAAGIKLVTVFLLLTDRLILRTAANCCADIFENSFFLKLRQTFTMMNIDQEVPLEHIC